MKIPFGTVKLSFKGVVQKDCNVQQDGTFIISTVTALQKNNPIIFNHKLFFKVIIPCPADKQ